MLLILVANITRRDTMTSMTEFTQNLESARVRAAKLRASSTKVGEENTEASLISPLLSALGWDTTDPEEVCHEYKYKPSDNPVDYALLVARSPRLLVEAKGLGENLTDHKWTNQAIGYAATAGVPWVVLTDGYEWQLYNAHALLPAEQKLLKTFTLDDSDAESWLQLISRSEAVGDRLAEIWNSEFVDREVGDTLTELFSG